MTLAWSTGGGHACVGVGAQSKACSTKKRELRQRRRTPSSALVRVTIIITVTPLVPHTQRNWTQSSKTATPRSPQGFRRSYQGFPDLRKLLRLAFVSRRLEVRFLSLAPALSNISPPLSNNCTASRLHSGVNCLRAPIGHLPVTC